MRVLDPPATWPYTDPATAAAFAGSVYAGDVDECWIWTGGLESQGGYGRWRPPGGDVIATHRWSFLAHHGPTDEPVIRHQCDVRCCANPHHLIDGTQAQNIRDTVERGAWRPIALPIWPTRAHRLRELALADDRVAVNELTARCEQLQLFASEPTS